MTAPLHADEVIRDLMEEMGPARVFRVLRSSGLLGEGKEGGPCVYRIRRPGTGMFWSGGHGIWCPEGKLYARLRDATNGLRFAHRYGGEDAEIVRYALVELPEKEAP